MRISSHFRVHSSDPAELVRVALNQFGGRVGAAEHFGVQPATVARWASRLPGRDIREELQRYLPKQETYVTIDARRPDSDTSHEHKDYTIQMTLDREEGIILAGLQAAGKDAAAEVFLLAEDHGSWAGSPVLAGTEFDYDWWYNLDDYDDYDIDEYADSEYALE